MNGTELLSHLIAIVRSGQPELTDRQKAMLLIVKLEPGPHTVRGLAKTLGIPKPTITRALNTFGSLGLAQRTRDEHDLRSINITLTTAGDDYLVATGLMPREGIA